jgi:hypothetical protein
LLSSNTANPNSIKTTKQYLAIMQLFLRYSH